MLNGALPPFALDGGFALAGLKAVWLAALFSAAGTLGVRLMVAPAAERRAPIEAPAAMARLDRLGRGSLAGALLAGSGWLLLQTATLGESGTLAEAAITVPTVVETTRFGHVLAAQMLAVGAALVLTWRGRRWPAAALTGAAVLLQVGHGHATAMGGPVLLGVDSVHLLAAAGWIGGLLPLLLLVRDTPPSGGAAAARAFAGVGRVCLFALLGSAAVQAWVLVGSGPGLLGTAYGWMVGVKAVLFVVLAWFAARNRYRLAPALRLAEPELARRHLVRSIAVQTGFGLATLTAAAVLTGLPPAIHVQPVWPFTLRPSLDAVRDDPDFAREAVGAVLALVGAVGSLALALVMRRWAAVLAVLAAIIAWRAVPHLDLLLAEAGPTTYFRSPTGFAATSVVAGLALYPTHCASCHGAEGHGDGPAGTGPVPPADLTAAHLWMHSDGELFGWLSDGIAAPTGPGLVMPGFADALTEDERWALMDAIRAHNAGLVRRATGAWSPPIAAPDFPAICPDSHQTSLSGLRGRPVLVALEPPAASLVADPAGVHPERCVSQDPAVPEAYAVVAGLDPDHLVGAQFLVDGGGWLRAVREAGAPDWGGVALAQAIARLGVAAAPAHAAMPM